MVDDTGTCQLDALFMIEKALNAVSVNTVVLLTPEVVDEIVIKSVGYRPPGK